MDKPQLFVFAGPNGAGKSTVSKWLLGGETDVFDGDKLLQELTETHPNTAWEERNRLSAQIFEERWQKVIRNRDDFAYETNFTYPQSINLPTTFRENGYETNLLYIGLDSVADSRERVDLRVKKGGHYVDDGSIELNFNGGIYHVMCYFAFFDRVLFIDNPIVTKPRIVLRAECGEIKSKSPTLPRWVTTHFAELLQS